MSSRSPAARKKTGCEVRTDKFARTKNDIHKSPLVLNREFGRSPDNLLINADASSALDAIGQRAKCDGGKPKVKLCYIDPPFNTGERFEHYDDRLDRSIWLENLRDHLVKIKNILADDGSIWVHLDDSEQHRARCLLDDIFGAGAFVATIIWQKRKTRDSRKAFSSMHDYIHVYAPAGPLAWKKVRNGVPDLGAFANPDNDPKGPWRSVPMSAQGGHGTASQLYTVATPSGTLHDPPAGRCWTYTKERLAALDADGRVYWPRGGHGKPRLKKYASEAVPLPPFTIWSADEVGTTASAKKDLLREFPSVSAFATPKPLALLERIIEIGSDPDDLILDCYLGSGTTAVAAQRTGRRWIGIEVSERTVRDFAIPRLQKELETYGGHGFAYAHFIQPDTGSEGVGA